MYTRHRQKSHAGSGISTPSALSNDTIKQRHSATCRVCLDDGEIPIFGVNDISEDVVEFGKIKVNKHDNLPQFLCEACYSLLEAAILFRKTAAQADKVLRNLEYSESNTEESDNKCENEPYIKREYLEFNVYSSDSDGDDFDRVLCEIKSQGTTSNTNLIDEQESYDCKDFQTNVLKEEKQDEMINQADNEMVMIIVSDNDKQKFGCVQCRLVCDTIEELSQHSEKAHPKLLSNQIKCEICFKAVNRNIYNEHVQEHREKYKNRIEKKYGKVECEFCGKKISKAYLKQHLKIHGTADKQAERLIECPTCKKMLSAHYYSDHMKRMHNKDSTTTKQKPPKEKEEDNSKHTKFSQCVICDKKIKESQYALHLARHGGPLKRYICDKCGKVFKHPSAFKTHCLIHGNELKYKCQFCPYRGLHQGLLKIHVRTHTGDYNYKCTECPARFITKSNLSRHLQRHKGICNFKCEVCQKGYYTKRDVERHMKNAHLTVKSHICETCGKAFNHRDNMLNHQLRVHKRDKIITRGRMPSYLKAEQKHIIDSW